MPVCCIGGVCIPYSAVVPLLLLGLKWLLDKLVRSGILPSHWQDGILRWLTPTKNKKQKEHEKGETTKSTKTTRSRSKTSKEGGSSNGASGGGGGGVRAIASEEEWNDFMSDKKKKKDSTTTNGVVVVVVKFTAAWCKPCHAIQPYYEELSKSTTSLLDFLVVDVDEVEDVAEHYGVAMLPTFLSLRCNTKEEYPTVLERMSGSDEGALAEFVKKAAASAQRQDSTVATATASTTKPQDTNKQD